MQDLTHMDNPLQRKRHRRVRRLCQLRLDDQRVVIAAIADLDDGAAGLEMLAQPRIRSDRVPTEEEHTVPSASGDR